jgi:hypothetical protein
MCCICVCAAGSATCWHSTTLQPSCTSIWFTSLFVFSAKKCQPTIPCDLLVYAGTFGRVLECWDRKYKDYCAVKIVRNVDKYRHAAMIEVRGLTLS